MTPDDDARLRTALRDAHAEDGLPPAFGRLWSASPRSRRARPGRWALAGALLTAAALAVLLVSRPPPGAPAWTSTGTRFVGPTDFLLDTPDLVTLRTLPRLENGALP